MLKIGITAFLLVLEIIFYHLFNRIIAYPFRIFIYTFLTYWYHSEQRGLLSTTDKLFLLASAIPIISPLPVYLLNSRWGSTLEVILIMISYQIIIFIFIREGAKINFSKKQGVFTKVLVPYVFFPLAFFFVIVFPSMELGVMLSTLVYVLQLIYMAVLSAFLPFPEKNKWYISLAMFFVMLGSGSNAYRMYVALYDFDYATVRICTTLFRLFLLLGFLNRKELQPK